MKKLISFMLAVSMLLSATACGREEDAKDNTEAVIGDLLDAAVDVIDRNFSGIVSSGKKYCVGEDAADYRKEIMSEEDFDDEWLMIVEDGDIMFFYAEDFDEPAECDGRMPKKYKGMTLEEIHNAYIDEQLEAEPPTEEATTAPVTTAVTTTTAPETTTAAAIQVAPGVEPVGELKLSSGGRSQLNIVVGPNYAELQDMVDDWIDYAGIDSRDVNYSPLYINGSETPERLDQMFISGEDIDLYFVEPDYALQFIDNPKIAAPMSDLGFSETHFSGAYPYTIELGRSSDGRFMSPAPLTSPGGFAYNTLLAEEYLGVQSPEEMQKKVSDWNKFQESAKTISSITGGKVALADSLGGLLFAYDQGRKSPWVFNDNIALDIFCGDMADTAKNLWDIGGVSKNDQWTYEWETDGESHLTMGYFTSNWGVGGFLLNAAGVDAYGEWAMCQGPQPYYWGGYSIVVNPATDNGDLAQSFIYYTCIDEGFMRYNITNSDGSYFVNNTNVMQYAIDNGLISVPRDVSGNMGGQDYLLALHKNGLAINNTGLVTPYDSAARSAFFNAVADVYCKGSGSYDDVAKKAEEYFQYYK